MKSEWAAITTALIALAGVIGVPLLVRRVSRREVEANIAAIDAKRLKDLADAAALRDSGGAGLFAAANETMALLVSEAKDFRTRLAQAEHSQGETERQLHEVLDHKEDCEEQLKNLRAVVDDLIARGRIPTGRLDTGTISVIAVVGLFELLGAFALFSEWIFGGR
jgi:hypothetical protein